MVKTDFLVENIKCDPDGRVLVFDIDKATFGNCYFHSGTDAVARAGREKLCSETIPNMLINSKEHGVIGGDLNCIIDKKDATRHPESKMSKCLQRLVRLKNWNDSYRLLHPVTPQYSRFYSDNRAEGASRIDRCYHYGGLKAVKATYIPLAFSDHFAHVIKFSVPDNLSSILSPKSRPAFKVCAQIIRDPIFK